LLAIVDGLDADHPDIPRHAIDVTVRDTVGAHNLSLVRKGLISPGAGAAGSEERKRKEFIKKVERDAAVAPGWTPDYSFHPMGFDLNGARGPSALRIVDFTSRLASQRTTEPQARIRRRSIQAVSRNISEWNATLIRARRPQPFPHSFLAWPVVGRILLSETRYNNLTLPPHINL
jgi:hypothetical protein